MNRMWICLLCAILVTAMPALHAEELSLGGLAFDYTISRVGHLFYDALIANWEIPETLGVISVHEKPNAFTGNVVTVEINNVPVYQTRLGTRALGIEEKALALRKMLMEYNQQQQELTL